MIDFVLAYSQALILQWKNTFDEGYVQAICTAKQNLFIVLCDYYNRVYLEHFQTKSKNIKSPFCQKEFEAAQQRIEKIYYT